MPITPLGAIAIGMLAANPSNSFDTATALMVVTSGIQQHRSNMVALRRPAT